MRNILIGLSGFLAACGTPAYHAPEVPVPATYNVGVARAPAPNAASARSEVADDPAPSTVTVSATLAAAPFWNELGDTTLTMLVREAQRANLDVRVAESRLSK